MRTGDPRHAGLQRWVRDLNHVYASEPALWDADFEPAGFSWIDCHDHDSSIVSLIRKADGPTGQQDEHMSIKADEISKIIREQIGSFAVAVDVAEVGTVVSLGDGIARVHGCQRAMAGEMLGLRLLYLDAGSGVPLLRRTVVDACRGCPDSARHRLVGGPGESVEFPHVLRGDRPDDSRIRSHSSLHSRHEASALRDVKRSRALDVSARGPSR